MKNGLAACFGSRGCTASLSVAARRLPAFAGSGDSSPLTSTPTPFLEPLRLSGEESPPFSPSPCLHVFLRNALDSKALTLDSPLCTLRVLRFTTPPHSELSTLMRLTHRACSQGTCALHVEASTITAIQGYDQ